MAVWRKKAYELLGHAPGGFSYKCGVVEVADALHDQLLRALADADDDLVRRIFEYALWADAQETAGHLRSAMDILFFIKLVSDPLMEIVAAKYLPPEIVQAKRALAGG